MMLPVSRLNGQRLSVVTTPAPWLPVGNDHRPNWLWLASWSAASYQATPPLLFFPPAVWIPEYTHLIQWEPPPVEVVPLFPQVYPSSRLHLPLPLPKVAESWISPEDVCVFQRRGKPIHLTNQSIQSPGHAPRSHWLLPPSQVSGDVRRASKKTAEIKHKGSSSSSSPSSSSPSSSSFSFSLPLHLLPVSPLHLSLRAAPPFKGRVYCEWAGLNIHENEEAWPFVLSGRPQIKLQPIRRLKRKQHLPQQVIEESFSSRLSLLTDHSSERRALSGGEFSAAFFLRTKKQTSKNQKCASADRQEGGGQEGSKDKLPIATSPVPGSPWCIVWTGDDRMFFFNPTIHLSVWERPGELIGRDITHIIKDPPHKRKRMALTGSCQSPDLHNRDEENEHFCESKRNRLENTMSLICHPDEVKLLPLELRVSRFREMMLERGVSAFSTYEKELHKMVFDPRYLLLSSDQRKQVFDVFVKSRLKDEYKEKKNKLQKVREDFKQLLEEAKLTSRSTFKGFFARYHRDQRFSALNRKKEQEVLFHHYVASLKKRDKENRDRKSDKLS